MKTHLQIYNDVQTINVCFERESRSWKGREHGSIKMTDSFLTVQLDQSYVNSSGDESCFFFLNYGNICSKSTQLKLFAFNLYFSP